MLHDGEGRCQDEKEKWRFEAGSPLEYSFLFHRCDVSVFPLAYVYRHIVPDRSWFRKGRVALDCYTSRRRGVRVPCVAAETERQRAPWNGSAWDVETVDTGGRVGDYTSFALDASGNPVISYYNDCRMRLCLARAILSTTAYSVMNVMTLNRSNTA